MVQCFNDATLCNANSNVMMITAGQCCNSTGGSSRHVRVVFQSNHAFCGNCFGEFSKLLFDICIFIIKRKHRQNITTNSETATIRQFNVLKYFQNYFFSFTVILC